MGTCVGSRYEHHTPFSRALGIADLRYLKLRPLPAITASTVFLDLTGRKPGSAFPKASVSLCDGTGILTSCPVGQLELRLVLGSTNPRLSDSAEEPLPLWPSGFAPDFRCYCDQDFPHHAVHTSSRPCFHPRGVPTYAIAPIRGVGGSRRWT